MADRPKKKDVALALLEKGSIFVHLDPRRDRVVVPQTFRAQPELVLQFGYSMRIPIPDLEVDDEGITGTLSFARRPFWVRIPWASVFAVVAEDRRGVVWPEDAPPETKVAAAAAAPAPAKRAHLRAVGPDDPAPAESGGEGSCSLCSTKWVEDAAACPVCGATREEAFRAASPPATEPKTDGGPPSEPPPEAPPPPPRGRPQLRLVKK